MDEEDKEFFKEFEDYLDWMVLLGVQRAPNEGEIYDSGELAGFKWWVTQGIISINGYVALPPSHPFYLAEYAAFPVEVHGGLTFGSPAWQCNEPFKSLVPDSYIIGFDTGHYKDIAENWTPQKVALEVFNLIDQLKDLKRE